MRLRMCPELIEGWIGNDVRRGVLFYGEQMKQSDMHHELLVALPSARCIAAHSLGAVYGMSM